MKKLINKQNMFTLFAIVFIVSFLVFSSGCSSANSAVKYYITDTTKTSDNGFNYRVTVSGTPEKEDLQKISREIIETNKIDNNTHIFIFYNDYTQFTNGAALGIAEFKDGKIIYTLKEKNWGLKLSAYDVALWKDSSQYVHAHHLSGDERTDNELLYEYADRNNLTFEKLNYVYVKQQYWMNMGE